MVNRKVLIVWELGGGLGHAMRCAALARALLQQGFHVTLAMRDVVTMLAADLPDSVLCLQAPLPDKFVDNFVQAESYAEILYTSGWHDLQVLEGLVAGWVGLMALSEADVVVVDHAPTAILAARVLELPCVRVGTGFFAPPRGEAGRAFPVLSPALSSARLQALARVEAFVLAAANAVIGDSVASLYELLQPQLDCLTGWPELDHYAYCRAVPLRCVGNANSVSVGSLVPAWPTTAGVCVLAYLKADYPALAVVLAGLAAAPVRVIAYVSGWSVQQAEAASTATLQIVTRPLDLSNLLPTTEALLCHAGSGTVALALAQKVPVLLLPETAEQQLFAECVVAADFGVLLQAPLSAQSFAACFADFLRACPRFCEAITCASVMHADLPADGITEAARLTSALLLTREGG